MNTTQNHRWTTERVLAAARGEFRLCCPGSTRERISVKLTRHQWHVFEEAQKNRFLRCKHGNNNFAIRIVWDLWCEANYFPFILISEKTRLSRVSMDMICTGRHLSEECVQYLERHVTPYVVKSDLTRTFGPVLSYVLVRNEDAEEVAREMLYTAWPGN